jgi:putative ABC transport system permease protein
LDQPQLANELRIVTRRHDKPTRAAAADAVEETLTEAGFEVQSAASVSRAEAISEGHMGPIVMIVLAIGVAMCVVGGIGLASTISTNVLDRTREFGVMHAIGARPKTVRRIVVAEGLFLTLTSFVVAAIPTLRSPRFWARDSATCSSPRRCPSGSPCSRSASGSRLPSSAARWPPTQQRPRASRITVREALAYL